MPPGAGSREITAQRGIPVRARLYAVGGRRAVGQDRDLAEEVASGEPRTLLPVDDDLRLAVEDHVEAASAHVLSDDALSLGEDVLAERVGEHLELRVRQIGEE